MSMLLCPFNRCLLQLKKKTKHFGLVKKNVEVEETSSRSSLTCSSSFPSPVSFLSFYNFEVQNFLMGGLLWLLWSGWIGLYICDGCQRPRTPLLWLQTDLSRWHLGFPFLSLHSSQHHWVYSARCYPTPKWYECCISHWYGPIITETSTWFSS